MPYRLLIAFVACIVWAMPLYAQDVPTDSTDADIETLLEESGQEDEEAQTQLAELLTELLENPLDINSASAEDLALIPAFGVQLAQRIVDFRTTFGLFQSIPELRAIEGISIEVYEKARPYLSIGERLTTQRRAAPRFPVPPSFSEFKRNLALEIIQRSGRRVELGSGYDAEQIPDKTYYLGSPYRNYTRIRLTSGRRFSLNLTTDKDAGEPFRWHPESNTYGYDYVSAHLAIKNYGRIESLVIGDYVAEFGQGLTLWRGIGFGKGSSATNGLIRSGRGLVAYGSSDENQFLRGVAASILITPKLGFHAFYSKRTLDASTELTEVTEGEEIEEEISSLRIDGYHRTNSELSKKDAVAEQMIGGALRYRLKSGILGVSAYQSKFENPFLASTAPYRRFDFTGDTDKAQSAFFNLNIKERNYIFGEIGRDVDGTIAGIGGLLHKLAPENEVIVLYRNYPKDFTPLHGYAFGERNGETNNESGFYTGVKLKPAKTLELNAYFDQFQFPWLRYTTYRPTQGTEWFARLDYRPKSWILAYLQFKSENKEEAAKTGLGNQVLNTVAQQNRASARLHLEYKFSRKISVRGRAEIVRYQFANEAEELGYILFQDIRYNPSDLFQIDFRYAFFDTDSYESRVYAFEKDVLYYMSNPAFSGQGQRFYVLLKTTPFNKKVNLWLKYGVTRFENTQTVGSGLDEVSGNLQSDVRIQLQLKL